MKQLILKSLTIFFLIFTFYLAFNTIPDPRRVIWSDSEGYYMYLPSVFIYKDFTKEAIVDTAYIRPFKDTEKIFSKYTCGVAILETPFFLASHIYAKISGQEANGKTNIYGQGLCLSAWFYAWLGMYFLYGYITQYYDKIYSFFALLFLIGGTNLYYYTFYAPAMSHVYSFFLFACFLWMTDRILIQKKFINQSQILSWSLYGLLFGMIVLVRPTNIIIALLPLYIAIKTNENLPQFLFSHRKYIVLAAFFFFIPWIPQFLYWKYISGDWFIWSYTNEGFNFWKEPKLFRVLFDAWNGWILYSPIVLFPLGYLWWFRKSNLHFERVYLYIFALATFIFASWWAWWFGGAFGHRSYVEFLALLALPMAGMIQKSFKIKWSSYVLLGLLVFFCYYNIGLTLAYVPPWDGPAWTYESWWNEVKILF